jgi:hypothetical protein
MKKNKVWRLLLLSLLPCLPLSGCVVMIDDHAAIADWPQLKIVEYHVGEAELRDQCARFAPPFTTAAACTLFYFDRREAHVYVSKDFPNPSILEHERLHAAGYDHVGSEAMQRLWQAWKTQNSQQQAALPAVPQPTR